MDERIFDVKEENVDQLRKEVQELNFNQINQLRNEIEELRKENFQLKLKLERQSDFIWDCFEQLGKKLDKDLNNLKEEIKEEIMNSKY